MSPELCALLRGEAVPWAAFRSTPDAFMEMCAGEGAVGLVAGQVAKLGGDAAWPEPLRRSLEEASRALVAEELVRQREIAAALAALANAGIGAILLKGTPLAFSLYKHSSQRPRADTDLLIRRDQVEATRATLSALGYGSPLYCDGDLLFCQFEMNKTDEFGILHAFDCHWKISTQAVFAEVLTYEELAAEAQPVRALGPHARGASLVHALLMACVHPVMHHRNVERLIWIYDIHLIASRLSDPELDRFVELAFRKRVASICAHGLRLARSWFGTGISDPVLAMLASAAMEESSSYLGEGRAWRHEVIASLRALPRWSDRLQLMGEILFPGAQYMLDKYRLPNGVAGKALLPALYMHRGMHGLWKIARGKK